MAQLWQVLKMGQTVGYRSVTQTYS